MLFFKQVIVLKSGQFSTIINPDTRVVAGDPETILLIFYHLLNEQRWKLRIDRERLKLQTIVAVNSTVYSDHQ